MTLQAQRLTTGDFALARAVFAAMAAGFEESWNALSDGYLTRLLARQDTIVLGVFFEQVDPANAVGGLTAHVLPMTKLEGYEIFIYDVAVTPAYQGHGAGTALLAAIRREAAEIGALSVFVPADNEDLHALAFYEATGGDASPVTLFTYDPAH
jgi:aminoglycoside 3-N-acetyltransferase I